MNARQLTTLLNVAGLPTPAIPLPPVLQDIGLLNLLSGLVCYLMVISYTRRLVQDSWTGECAYTIDSMNPCVVD